MGNDESVLVRYRKRMVTGDSLFFSFFLKFDDKIVVFNIKIF
jgi:hypothetical protein